MSDGRVGPLIDVDNREFVGASVAELCGRTLVSIDGLHEASELCRFADTQGVVWQFWHVQDCCEGVEIAQVDGDPSDLIGRPLEMAEMSITEKSSYGSADQFTFYRFATSAGYVTVRWDGASNGYYSLDVNLERTVARE